MESTQFWYVAVIALYLLGFSAAVAGAVAGIWRTIVRVSEVWVSLLRLDRDRQDRIEAEIIDGYLASQRRDETYEIRELRLLRSVSSIVSSGVRLRQDGVTTFTREVLRANKPTGLGVLVGAVLTTVASIMALYPPN